MQTDRLMITRRGSYDEICKVCTSVYMCDVIACCYGEIVLGTVPENISTNLNTLNRK